MYNYMQYLPRRFTLVLFDLVDYILVFICSIQSTTKFHQPRHHHFCQYKQISKYRLGKIADSAILTCTSIANFALNMPRKLDFCQLSKNFQNKDQVKLSCHTRHFLSNLLWFFKALLSSLQYWKNTKRHQRKYPEKNNDMQSVHISNQN